MATNSLDDDITGEKTLEKFMSEVDGKSGKSPEQTEKLQEPTPKETETALEAVSKETTGDPSVGLPHLPAKVSDEASNPSKFLRTMDNGSSSEEPSEPLVKRPKVTPRRSTGKSVPPKITDSCGEDEDEDKEKLLSGPSPAPKPPRGKNQAEVASFLEFFKNACIPVALVNRALAADAEARELERVFPSAEHPEHSKEEKLLDKQAMVDIVSCIVRNKELRNEQKKTQQMKHLLEKSKETVAEQQKKIEELISSNTNLAKEVEDQKQVRQEAKDIINTLRFLQ